MTRLLVSFVLLALAMLARPAARTRQRPDAAASARVAARAGGSCVRAHQGAAGDEADMSKHPLVSASEREEGGAAVIAWTVIGLAGLVCALAVTLIAQALK